MNGQPFITPGNGLSASVHARFTFAVAHQLPRFIRVCRVIRTYQMRHTTSDINPLFGYWHRRGIVAAIHHYEKHHQTK